MDISNISGALAANANADTNGAYDASIDKQFADLLAGNKATDDPETYLKNLTKNGISSYWSAQVDKIKAKVTAEVMAAHHVTEDSLKAMNPDDRAAMESQIMQEVEERVKELVKESMQGQTGTQGQAATASPTLAGGAIAQPTTPPQDAAKFLDIAV